MDRWARIVDHLLSGVIGDGDISDLPGAGKKLPLREDSHTPLDQRVAFKIMQDNDVAPEWMALANSLDQSEAQIRAEVEATARELAAAYGDKEAVLMEQLGTNWSPALERLQERINHHNRDVQLYNLKVPAGIPHRPVLAADKLLKQALAKTRRET